MSNLKVALVGFSIEGRASYDYYRVIGADITICDENTELVTPDDAKSQLGSGYLDNLDRFDIIVRTAGLPPRLILEKNPGVAAKITTHVNEFLRVCPTRNIIGVTGTKGKGTTSSLINGMLAAAGKQVKLGGNIGLPPLTFLGELNADSWVVLELSSFQLMDIQHSPHIAVCLMIVPEHLNWHQDMAEYVRAKSHLFEYQTSDDITVYLADNPITTEAAAAGAGQKIPYYRSPGAFVNGNMITIDGQEICTTDELQLLGRHNWQNACAAVTAVWQAGVHDIAAMRRTLTSFSGLEYHIEFIRELDGVRYYNDGFGTTPETAIVAMEAFAQPKVMIMGGSDKGVPFDELAEAIKQNNVRHIVLMGNSDNPDNPSVSPKLEATLQQHGVSDVTTLVTPGGPSVTEVVAAARQHAQPGDIVMISAGCASFDMFPNYKARGEAFTAAFKALH
jgi:UDP-N-acetylmuramoylalanine--D-glutamate ligase